MLEYVVAAGGVGVALAAAWLAWAPGPRRRRTYRRGRRLLADRQWEQALARVRAAQQGKLSPAWRGRFANLEGECLRQAADEAVEQGRFEQAIEHAVASARLLHLDESEARSRVLDALLAELRRRFALDRETRPARELIDRLLKLDPVHAEALFWLGLCELRDGRDEQALALLRRSEETDRSFFDPPFYLGAVLLQKGQASEALRHLSEANRRAPGCPLVSWQLGLGLVAAQGDAVLAVRALQRALAPAGLPRWLRQPELAWNDSLPGPARSYLQRLAAKHPYTCPVLGTNVAAQVRQARLALARAHERLGNWQESARLYDELLQESAPTVPVLRGLGMALARLERYDEAFKHLRAAHEMEEPKDHLTAGYLALCGARGKPSRPEDKPNNVRWAMGLLGRFAVRGDAEWARLNSAVFAEARALGLPLAVADQVRLCDLLASVSAAHAEAAAAYDQLAADAPDALQTLHAWLYCRAAQEHGCTGRHDLDLFRRAFADLAAARRFFQEHGWDADEIEYALLHRWAGRHPGQFPDFLGPDYRTRGEALLNDRCRRLEQAGRTEAAIACAEDWLRLAPASAAAHDRLAALAYRSGNLDRSAAVLRQWHAQAPADPWPLIRLAVVEQQRGGDEACLAAVREALARTSASRQAEVACLGARLALRCGRRNDAVTLLEQCLQIVPGHVPAVALLAAVLANDRDYRRLAALRHVLERLEPADPCVHYLAGVAHLAGGDPAAALAAAHRVEGALCTAAVSCPPRLEAENRFLIGCAHLRRGETELAVPAFRETARAAAGPSARAARALLGQLAFQCGNYDEAAGWWNALAEPSPDPSPRHQPDALADGRLDEVLVHTVYLAGLSALADGRYEEAAERFRQVESNGFEPSARTLRGQALFLAAGRLLAAEPAENGTATAENAAALLHQAMEAGDRRPAVALLLAQARARQGQLREARQVLRQIASPDARVWLQLGLLSLAENQLAQAEQEFAQAAQLEPDSHAVHFNLVFTRLSLGQAEQALELLPRVIDQTADADDRRLFELLAALLQSNRDWEREGRPAIGPPDPTGLLVNMSLEDEERLLGVLRTLGHAELLHRLTETLLALRPARPTLRQARVETTLLKARWLLDRCDWLGAERTLTPLARDRAAVEAVPPAVQAGLFNLLGCAAALGQDFQAGLRHFTAALKRANDDPRILQNLALVHEWLGDLERADPFWRRYLAQVDDRLPAPPDRPDYPRQLMFQALGRLSQNYADKGRWNAAIHYAERAHHLEPKNADMVDRLFHLYTQAHRPEEARAALAALKQLRPAEPELELYELDISGVRDILDIERAIGGVARILNRHAAEPRVEERAAAVFNTILQLLGRMCDQLSDQLNKVMEQVRSLPNYQVNWPAVHDLVHDLHVEFGRLRRAVDKCFPLLRQQEHHRVLSELLQHIDRKIEFCKRWEGP